MYGLGKADIAVLVLYFLGTIAIGVYAARLVKNMGDFFMPRRFGKLLLTTHAFGTGTHSDQAVGVAAKTYTNGLSGIWYQWLWLFCTPFYWLIAPILRRTRAITMSDVFTARFDQSVGYLFAVVGTLQLSFNIGVMLKGSGAVISACFGKDVSADLVIIFMTVLFVAYGVCGGLAAAIITDFVQGILTVIFSFVLVPFVIQAVGGMTGLQQSITDSKMFSLVAPGDIGLFYIIVIAINALIGIVTQPHTMGTCAAGRSEYAGRFGFTMGNFIKRVCTMAWCITGLAAVAYIAKKYGAGAFHEDEIYGVIARDFLPVICPGLLGVFLASLLASVMSSCDSFMIASSALFTENVYKPIWPKEPDKHYVTVGRVTAVVVVLCGVTVAYTLPSVVKGIEIFWKIAPMMGIAFWLGLFWRRASSAGAWASTLAGFGMWFLTEQHFFKVFLQSLELGFVKETATGLTMYLPWQMVFYLTVGTFVGIVVSLMTRPVADEKLDRFYELIRTPVEEGEPAPIEPCKLPEGMTPPEKRLLFKFWNLEVLVPTRLSVVGFVLSWVAVVGMIVGFWALTR